MARWDVGPEYDQELPRRLIVVAHELGYAIASQWNAMVGSQDIWHLELRGGRGSVEVHCETYMGLSVEGPDDLLDELRSAFERAPKVAVDDAE